MLCDDTRLQYSDLGNWIAKYFRVRSSCNWIKQQEVELRVRLVSTGEYLYYRGQRMYVLMDKDESYVDIMKASYISE